MIKSVSSYSNNKSVSFNGNKEQKKYKAKNVTKFIAREALKGATVSLMFDAVCCKGLGVSNMLKRSAAFAGVWVAMGFVLNGINKLFSNNAVNK